MSESVLNYQIDGTNRGGTLHATLLARKLEGRVGDVALALNDIEPGRSARLARQLSQQGIEVKAYVQSAHVSPDAHVQCLAVDNPSPLVPILESAVRTPLLEIGQLLSPSAGSGSVFGIGVVLSRSDLSGRQDALQIFSRLSALAPERKTSRVMSSPIRHSVQMLPVRHWLHDYLTEKSVHFIKGRETTSEFRVFDGLAQGNYPAVIAEAGRGTKRRDLRGVALHDLAPHTLDGRFAVIFYDRTEAWIYVVLAMRRTSRPHLVSAVELPSAVPAPPPLPMVSARSSMVTQASRSWSQVLITD